MSEEEKQYWMERSHELWKPRHLTEEEKIVEKYLKNKKKKSVYIMNRCFSFTLF